MENQSLALVTKEDLSLAGANNLNEKQLQLILQSTPPQYIKQRPAKGGGTWDYVTGGYIKKCLNIMFGWDWDFEILDQQILHGEVVVKGKLTCRSNGHTIVKMQYGNKDIVYRKQVNGETERQPLSIGNDLKAAATDCLKKCASEIGIAADIYNKEDFHEVMVEQPITLEDLRTLFELKKLVLSDEEMRHGQRIIDNNETASFKKLHDQLQSKWAAPTPSPKKI